MINDIRAKADEIVRSAVEQSERMMNALNAAVDMLAAGQAAFNVEMQAVAAQRRAADKRQAEAMRNFDTVCTQFTAVVLGLKNQISAGSIISEGGPVQIEDQTEQPAPAEAPAEPPHDEAVKAAA